nr:polyprenyl synthetase family protein [Pirellula sp.]
METTETSPHRMFADTSGTAAVEPMRDSDAYRYAFQHAIACIASGMERVEDKIRTELQSQDPLVSEMLQYVAGLGGKRLRPALALLSARWLGKVTDETVRLATVVELVHTATLVHDDILDHATLRRHKPTVHVRWNVPSSVLIGDWLFTNAYRLANEGESTLPGRWVAVAAQRVCEGEIRQ